MDDLFLVVVYFDNYNKHHDCTRSRVKNCNVYFGGCVMSKMSDLYIKVEESATLTELEERVVSNWNIKAY